MSRVYDHWEKLVGAVLRREKDRQLAYCESFSTRCSSDLGSPFSLDLRLRDATEAVTYEFDSRKQIEEDIMSTLIGGHVKMIGICGMGGLGKTTMAKRIMNRALEEHVLEDSWLLFRMRAGKYVDDTKLNSIVKEVVNECKGLPIALITVGAALKDEVDVDIWKNALQRLRKCDPDIPKFIENVYNPLKLSYDVFDTKYKLVFLLCCLYPEDANIPLELLTYFCMGLCICEGGITTVEEARNRIRALMKVLKSRSLLLDSTYQQDAHVRMHVVVRDVCIFIAKHEGYIGDHDCTWISSFHRSELPIGLAVPNLRLLFWTCNWTIAFLKELEISL